MDIRLEMFYLKRKKDKLYVLHFTHGLRKSLAAVCLKPDFVAWCSTSDLGNSLAASSSRLGNATYIGIAFQTYCFYFQSMVSTPDV